MKAIEPGTRVECIKRFVAPYGEILPNVGHVYTVRDIRRGFFGEEGLRLKEIVNLPRDYLDGFNEAAFDIKHFRPVDEGNIQIFRDLAANPKEKVRA